ncbi:MAG: CHASE2 domain-containing protein, partial [Gammaproteobacteria bacterium]
MKFKISSADCVRGIKLGLTTALFGIVLSVVPPIVELEKNFGLAWMFELRGPRPAPSEVVIVSIDSESARELGLEENPILWPRSVHAHLVKKLKEYGARVIVFDVFFRSKRELSSDQELAQEFSRAGNVILFAHLNQRPAQIPDDHGGLQTILMDQLVPPTQTIAAGALSYAPFPLPKIPARVNQTWLFKASSGDIPTIPVLAMHRYAARDFDDFRSHLLDRISDRNPGINTPQIPQGSKDLFDTIRRVRQAIQTRPDLLQNPKAYDPNGNSPSQFELFRSLYLGPDNRYIDFYGPPQTIQTIPYYQIIRGNGNNTAFNFHDKAVFVGNSERYQPDLKDDFHTVFSEDNGSDLSGVEIMATVFANLLEGRSVQPIEWLHQLGLLAFWGLGIGALFYLAPGVTAIITAALLAAAYLAIAATLFERDGTWFSLVTPLLIQLPFALLGAMLLRYRFTHRAHQKIQRN